MIPQRLKLTGNSPRKNLESDNNAISTIYQDCLFKKCLFHLPPHLNVHMTIFYVFTLPSFFSKTLFRMLCRVAHVSRTMDWILQYQLFLWSLSLVSLSCKMDHGLQSCILSLACMVIIYLCLVWIWGGVWNDFCESLSLLFWQQWLTTQQHTLHDCRWDKIIIFKGFWLP